MTIAFRAAGSAAPFAAASSVAISRPVGTAAFDFLCITLAVEAQAAASGPWTIPNTGQFAANVIGPSSGWLRVGYLPPSASGVGLEVWAAINGGSGAATLNLTASLTGIAVMTAYTGVYYTTGSIFDGAVRASVFQTWTGNAPQSPAINAFTNEMVLACGGMLMSTPGFGTPTGNANESAYTNRVDVARSAFGNGETTMADALAVAVGTTGAITFPGTAASGAAHGVMATLAVQPLGVITPGAVSPFILMEYPLA